MKTFYKTLLISNAFFPIFVYAQEAERLGGTRRLLEALGGLIKTAIPIVFALAVLVFFWGIVKFIWSSGSGKDEAKRIMLWGVIAIFVMSSIWGLVAYIKDVFGVGTIPNMNIPTIGGSGGGVGGGGDCIPDPITGQPCP